MRHHFILKATEAWWSCLGGMVELLARHRAWGSEAVRCNSRQRNLSASAAPPKDCLEAFLEERLPGIPLTITDGLFSAAKQHPPRPLSPWIFWRLRMTSLLDATAPPIQEFLTGGEDQLKRA